MSKNKKMVFCLRRWGNDKKITFLQNVIQKMGKRQKKKMFAKMFLKDGETT